MTHLLKVNRYNFKPDWTIGKLLVNGVHDGYTVEDEIREGEKIKGETAIPYGVYKLGFRQSPKFSTSYLYSDSHNLLIEPKEKAQYAHITDWRNHDLIWVLDVPGFQYILIHWGNTDDDTEGCLIVGAVLGVFNGQEGVGQSRAYYKKLYCKVYPAIKAGGQTIQYTPNEIV